MRQSPSRAKRDRKVPRSLPPMQQSASEPLFGHKGLGFMGEINDATQLSTSKRKRNRKLKSISSSEGATNERILDVFDEVAYHSSHRKLSTEGLEEDQKVFWRALGWYHNTAVMKSLEEKDYDGATRAINNAQTHFESELPPPARPKSAARGPEKLHALDSEKYHSCINLLQKAKTKQSQQPDVFQQVKHCCCICIIDAFDSASVCCSD